MSTLASWSGFILLHVLPIAISQIVDWVREWQILVAALILLIFFHFWTRGVLRAAREAAKETVLSETRAFDAGLKLLRRQVEGNSDVPKAPPAAPKVVPERGLTGRTQPAVRVEPTASVEVARTELAADGHASVERLRQAIRLALSTLPTSDDPLPAGSLRLYRAAIDGLDGADLELGGRGRPDVLDQIRTELSVLKQAFPPQSCRLAWQSLVKVNTLAREFYEKAPLTRAETLNPGTRIAP